jgi:hypothetical protein
MRRTWWCLGLLLLPACGPRELRVSMKSDNNSGQTGFAVIEEVGKTLTVTVETSVPDYVNQGQLAHIHRGSCGEILEAAVTLTTLNRLAGTPDRWGSTTEKITLIKLDDFKTGAWAINVHDERDRSVYVSCGEIPRP